MSEEINTAMEPLPDANYYMPGKIGFFNTMYPDAAAVNGVNFDKMTRISAEDYQSFINPPEGKYLVFDESGPRLESIPEPDYLAIAEDQKDSLLSEATTAITVWQTKLLMGRTLTAAEIEKLNAWMDYIDVLNDTDLSDAPDVRWPTKPA